MLRPALARKTRARAPSRLALCAPSGAGFAGVLGAWRGEGERAGGGGGREGGREGETGRESERGRGEEERGWVGGREGERASLSIQRETR